MISVWLDTNVVHDDPYLLRQPAKSLLAKVLPSEIEVVVPYVVREELARQERERETADLQAAKSKVADLVRPLGVDVADVLSLLDELPGRIAAMRTKRRGELASELGTQTTSLPSTTLKELLTRDLEARRPFTVTTTKGGAKRTTTGLRDTLIWLSVVQELKERAATTIVLVSADQGFVSQDGESLHGDLTRDLENAKIDTARVVLTKSIGEALSTVDKLTGHISPRDHAIQRAAWRSAELLREIDWVGHTGHGGEWEEPEFPVPILSEPETTDVDVFITGVESIGTGPAPLCTIMARLSFSGPMLKVDWYLEDDGYPGDIDLQEDLNSHYFLVAGDLNLRIALRMSYEDSTSQATVTSVETVEVIPMEPRA